MDLRWKQLISATTTTADFERTTRRIDRAVRHRRKRPDKLMTERASKAHASAQALNRCCRFPPDEARSALLLAGAWASREIDLKRQRVRQRKGAHGAR